MPSVETKSNFTYCLTQYKNAVSAWEKDPDQADKLSILFWSYNNLNAALASAIGWDKTVLKIYIRARLNPVAMFEEGNRIAQTQVVVYFGDNRFITHGSMRDAIETINNYWDNDPTDDIFDCAWYGSGHGVKMVRDNIRQVYGHGEGTRGGMKDVWAWLDGYAN
ncbi:hypothetical protein GYMLUDRAFT_265999 [Collybiopsis luxurians FD-317 M1]|uniref:Uncharacterized protein n=1 Tax=Collybiopsis luxurians FD-317 M1 TaxID=944289 RepID=A0A0D0BNG9_9AGAR|nr:hypothetical protein GYMLUDRAFT_265999 [Collybiopsis luxurians FD-317 M1]